VVYGIRLHQIYIRYTSNLHRVIGELSASYRRAIGELSAKVLPIIAAYRCISLNIATLSLVIATLSLVIARDRYEGVTKVQFVRIFLWAIIGRGGRRAGWPDPLPPSVTVINRIKIEQIACFIIILQFFMGFMVRIIKIMSN
jgi:hypothetical protein